MLTAIVLRDREIAALSRTEVLALEYLLHERFSEIARTRKSGDSALLLAIRAADYLAPLLDDLGQDETTELLDAVAESDLGAAALSRAEIVADLTHADAA